MIFTNDYIDSTMKHDWLWLTSNSGYAIGQTVAKAFPCVKDFRNAGCVYVYKRVDSH